MPPTTIQRLLGEMTTCSGVPAVDGPPLGVAGAGSRRPPWRRKRRQRPANEGLIPADADEIENDEERAEDEHRGEQTRAASAPPAGDDELIPVKLALVAPDVTPGGGEPLELADVPAPLAPIAAAPLPAAVPPVPLTPPAPPPNGQAAIDPMAVLTGMRAASATAPGAVNASAENLFRVGQPLHESEPAKTVPQASPTSLLGQGNGMPEPTRGDGSGVAAAFSRFAPK